MLAEKIHCSPSSTTHYHKMLYKCSTYQFEYMVVKCFDCAYSTSDYLYALSYCLKSLSASYGNWNMVTLAVTSTNL